MAGGLKALVLLERAHLKRISARHLRASTAAYTNEEEWVRKSRKLAKEEEKEAEHLEYMARHD